MKLGPEALQERVDRFKEGLRRSGVKMTHQRMEIFREVAGTEEHPDAETIFKGVRKRVPSISLDTVYRTLWSLIDHGLLTTIGHPHERVRFDANVSAHHHFVCVKCGLTRDFRSEEFDRLTIPDAVKAFGNVEKTQVEIRGTCSRCSGKTNPKRCASRRKEE